MKQIKTVSKASKLTSKNFVAINIIDQQSKIFILPCGDSIFIAIGATCAIGATGKFNKTEFVKLNDVTKFNSIVELCDYFHDQFGIIEIYKFKTRKKMFKYLSK